jgi:hypothetical protein
MFLVVVSQLLSSLQSNAEATPGLLLGVGILIDFPVGKAHQLEARREFVTQGEETVEVETLLQLHFSTQGFVLDVL